jgi:hypothetical protein
VEESLRAPRLAGEAPPDVEGHRGAPGPESENLAGLRQRPEGRLMDITMVRTLNGLTPADDAGKEVLKRWPVGQALKVDVRKPRAHRSLRRYWGLVNLVFENSDQFKSTEQVHQYLKIRAGHCTHIVNKATGETFLIADSINYDNLDEDEFQKVWNSVVNVVCEEILPGITQPEIEHELQKCMGLAA